MNDGFLSGAVKLLTMTTEHYIRDIHALGQEGMEFEAGGVARRGYDFTYEVGFVAHRIARRLRSEPPGDWPWEEGYALAPAEFRSIDAIVSYLAGSTQAVIEAMEGASSEQWAQVFEMGPMKMTAQEVAIHALDHMAYHMGQLNFIQMIRGDAEFHFA